MKKISIIFICIALVTILIFIMIFALRDKFSNEEVVISKDSDDGYSFNGWENEYQYEKLNNSIEYQKYFSYEEKKANKLYVTIHNNSEKTFNSIEVYVIHYNKEKAFYITQESIYYGMTPRSKYMVDLGYIPEESTKHDIIIIPSLLEENAKDMSDYVKANIVNKNDQYYCKIENKSNSKIETCNVQMIFYDKENNIVDVKNEGFRDVSSIDAKEHVYLDKDFDHYETNIIAYNYIN